ncbi:MAG TPA: protein kinase [Bryobacteraceae bacterium]|nr:protein kinase [Bryobacteraceae bacterium]
MSIEPRTLSQRLDEGKLAAAEALRLAMNLAEALRKLHDNGQVYGALTPSRVEITSSGVSLAAVQSPQRDVTPYTAPEVLRGRVADARSDIFSFGSILFEMVTGRPPFEGATPEALTAAVFNTPAPPTGNPRLDALIANCLAKDPSLRWQRIQKAQLELRLLTVTARRPESPLQRENVAALVRTEVQHALAARCDAQDKTIAEFQQAVTASMQAIQAHLCTLAANVTAAQEGAKRSEEAVSKLNPRISTLEERGSVPSERVAATELLLQTATERITRTEATTESVRKQAADFAESAALQLHALEQTVRSQADALESARTALAQTDDLVERVVEALDSLQSIVLERAEDRPAGVN